MDITITWDNPGGLNPTDTFTVLYKIYDVNDTYPWIIANAIPLPSTATTYTITGLDPNVIYRVAVTKSCDDGNEVVTEDMFIDLQCPLLSLWQGAPVSGFPTLYYSVYYPDSIHVKSAKLTSIDSTSIDRFPVDCNLGPTAVPTGRTIYQISDVCPVTGDPSLLQCNTQEVDFLTPSSLTSAAGLYGLDNSSFVNPPCDGTASDPILYRYGANYKFYIETVIQNVAIGFNLTYSTQDANCQDPGTSSSVIFSLAKADIGLISGSSCYDPNTCKVSVTVADGTNLTNISDYNPITYFTTDASVSPPVVTTLPLVDDAGVPLTGPHVEYYIYCPINFSVNPLVPGILSAGMSFEFWLSSPAPALIYTASGLNYTGLTLPQVYAAIAADITSQTAFTAKYVQINGSDYIKIFVCGADYVSGEITVSGPNLLGVDSDIPQVDPYFVSNYGISDAFIYDAGAGDMIYGCRGLSGSDSGLIQVTDIAGATTTEYNHLIDIPINQITLVEETPPTTAYQLQNFTVLNKAYETLNVGIVKNNALTWNDGFVYVTEDNFGQTITVYDQNNNQVDSYTLSVAPVTYIEVNQASGNILLLLGLNDNGLGSVLLSHTGIGLWAEYFGYMIDATDAYRLIGGTVTGKGSFTVLSSTATSITVAGNPWTNNEWSNYRIYVDTGALPDKQAVLYDYNPPTQPNFANTSNTIFIDPTYPVTFDASLLNPGDTVYFLGLSDSFSTVYDNTGSWLPGDFDGWDLTFVPNMIVAGIGGVRYFVSNSLVDQLEISQYTVGGYYAKTSFLNGTKSNLLPGLNYVLYRNICGGLIYNPFVNQFYFSKGKGLVDIIGSTGGFIATINLLDTTGTPLTEGSFHFAVDPITGDMYGIARSADITITTDAFTLFTSPDIYRMDAAGTPLPAINGSNRWNDEISGRISYEGGKLYFTSNMTRKLYEYDIALDTFNTYVPPPVYKKSETTELVEGAVHLSGSKFVMMNRLDNAVTSTAKTKYLFTNLFIYDIVTDTVDTVLVGANTKPYSGAEDTWNQKDLGEMFGEYNGFKDYCLGGLSINTYNDRIYFKQYKEESYYMCEPVAETGVAQIWCIGKNQVASNDGSTYRLIRIFNIQSDGSLQSSVRTLYTYKNTRSTKQGPVFIKYDPYYNGVLGVTDDVNELILIDANNFTGYYGGPNNEFVNLTLNTALSIDTTALTYPIYNPTRFINDGIGAVYLFGKQSGSETFNYRVYFDTDIISESVSVSLSGNTGTPGNPGLFNTGSTTNYQPFYDSVNNRIWMMGNLTETGARIIKIYNVAMAPVATINLTTLNAVPTGNTYLYQNVFHIPALNMMVYYGATNDKLLILHDTTYAVRYNGTASSLLNSHRTPALGSQNIGWMVPYQDGFFIDRNDVGTTDEFWTYLKIMDFSFIGYVHYDLEVNVFNNNIFNLLTGGSNVTTNNLPAITFGQWKITSSTSWASLAVSNPVINANDVLELVMFDVTKPLIKVENVTAGITWDLANYNNLTTLPTFSTLNSVNIFSIKADSINLSNNDILELTFENPLDPNCPFVTLTIVNF